MADYITKIRTADGDKQIDYNALANVPLWTKLYDGSITTTEPVTLIQESLLVSCEGMTEFWIRASWTANANPDLGTGNDNVHFRVGKGQISYGRFCDPTNAGNLVASISVTGEKSFFQKGNLVNGLEFNITNLQTGYCGACTGATLDYEKFTFQNWTAGYQGTLTLLIYGK